MVAGALYGRGNRCQVNVHGEFHLPWRKNTPSLHVPVKIPPQVMVIAGGGIGTFASFSVAVNAADSWIPLLPLPEINTTVPFLWRCSYPNRNTIRICTSAPTFSDITKDYPTTWFLIPVFLAVVAVVDAKNEKRL